MKEITVLFGKPNAGKGTRVGEFLAGKEDSFETISTSTLLKKARKEQTELGKQAEFYMNSGKLVPDELINQIVIDGIKSATKNVFLDGFPRTIGQAQAMIDSGIIPDKVVHFYVDDDLALFRAKTRLECKSCGKTFSNQGSTRPKVEGICNTCGGNLGRRKDDEEEVVKNRLEVYNFETYPVLDFFKSQGIEICTIDNSDPPSARKLFAELFA